MPGMAVEEAVDVDWALWIVRGLPDCIAWDKGRWFVRSPVGGPFVASLTAGEAGECMGVVLFCAASRVFICTPFLLIVFPAAVAPQLTVRNLWVSRVSSGNSSRMFGSSWKWRAGAR